MTAKVKSAVIAIILVFAINQIPICRIDNAHYFWSFLPTLILLFSPISVFAERGYSFSAVLLSTGER